MSKFLERFKTDKTLEREGTWVELGDGIAIKVVRINHPDAQALRKKLEKPYRHYKEGVPDDVLQKIVNRVLAEEILRDWRGITDLDGREIPYTTENAQKLIDALEDFRDEVAKQSLERENFKAAAVEDAGKN